MTDQEHNNLFSFSQIHIEVARNATDDFNLFHDKRLWRQITGNPFQGPIVLGFQLECLIEHHLRMYREAQQEHDFISQQQLGFSNYQFTFANAVKPEQPVRLEIKKSVCKSGDSPLLSNRIAIKGESGTVLLGYKKETRDPLFLPEIDLDSLPDLNRTEDRSFLPDSGYFLKRKYMNVGNAKNFLTGSLAEQSDYFNELDNKFVFPETFPVALLSCALLERALKQGHDFRAEPMVYTSHKISVDRALNATLKSNDKLHILVAPPQSPDKEKSLGAAGGSQQLYRCFGLLEKGAVLFRAEIALAALSDIIKS